MGVLGWVAPLRLLKELTDVMTTSLYMCHGIAGLQINGHSQ